ncbi:MAG: hypothetical protein CO093_09750 [Alphaproteobacteria bacterium CG_4_9_14_3_um_filter_47_13]|nr:MAG: hypothetical protein CO093_09750 [Alphaproteobacteria bacterium CG_4_9_14_3_um_filter_47_13]
MTHLKLAFSRKLFPVFFLIAGLVMAGCYFDLQELRLETAKRIATPSFMLHREIRTEPFLLTAYERVHQKGAQATVYIEGDGVAWIGKSRPSLDPTPRNPVALHLASRDNSPNVIYLARPCQYSGLTVESPCDLKYWTSDRFSPEVVNVMSAALDNIKRKYSITRFNLVGFSGGGAIAALLTAQRDDVATLRTVAGNLDHVLLNRMHEVSQMPHSLNPVDISAKIAHIPQHHFIGEWDEVVTPAIFDSYRATAGASTCIRSSMVKRVDHETGWVNVWPEIMNAPLDCEKF